jgi:hypothetical protein
LIIDLQDTFSSFSKWNKIREKYYKSKRYPMKVYDVENGLRQETPIITFIKDISADTKTSRTSGNTDKPNLKNKQNNKKDSGNCNKDETESKSSDTEENEPEIDF